MNQDARLPIIHGFRCAAIIAAIVTVIVASIWQPRLCAQTESLPSMNLTVIALNGTQLVLNSTDIGSLPSYRAFGGYKNQLGNIRGLGNYTGVPITALCDLVGGINSNQCLLVTASDDYSMVFSYAEVFGDIVTYNPETGDEVQHLEPLTTILAYYKNDANLSSTDGGPLRLAIVGSEGLATDSTYWVKWVVRLEIHRYDDVAVTAVTLSKTVVGKTCTCLFNVTVENLGSYSETFNVTLYANATVIDTITNVVLANRTSRILSFSWNTAGSVYGKYTISAKTTAVPYEINTANNSHAGGTVTVTILGDVDGDFDVDIFDAVAICSAYGSRPPGPQYTPNLDINGDGIINIYDAVITCTHYGHKYP